MIRTGRTKKVYEERTIKKKQRGRPKKTWTEEVREAAEMTEMDWKELRKMTQDRKEWREAWRLKPRK